MMAHNQRKFSFFKLAFFFPNSLFLTLQKDLKEASMKAKTSHRETQVLSNMLAVQDQAPSSSSSTENPRSGTSNPVLPRVRLA